jgi:hypothetical protein
MYEWLEGLQKSAKRTAAGVGPEDVRRAETECGVPFPEELGALYRTFDGGELQGDVTLFSLHGPEGAPSVLEKSRLKLESLPAAGVWRLGVKGPHHQLFAARKSAMVEQADSPLPAWAEPLSGEDWIYGTWETEKRELRLYRSLRDMLEVLVSPAAVQGALNELQVEYEEGEQPAAVEEEVEAEEAEAQAEEAEAQVEEEEEEAKEEVLEAAEEELRKPEVAIAERRGLEELRKPAAQAEAEAQVEEEEEEAKEEVLEAAEEELQKPVAAAERRVEQLRKPAAGKEAAPAARARSTVKKAAGVKTAAKAPAKKAPVKKVAAKKAAVKKVPAKKAAVKKVAAKKAPVKKAPAKKAPKALAKKAAVKKVAAKKAPARKAASTRTASKRGAARGRR